MIDIDKIDVKGNLETIAHLAEIGMLLVDLDKMQHIPTILEDVLEHSQRLVLEYAVKEE